MFFYIARRLAWTVIVVLIVLLLTFAVFYLLPAGDPALRFAGKSPTPESLALIRERLGLDQPWYEQFGRFVGNFVTGDENGWPGLGYSYVNNEPVIDLVTERLPRTLLLIAGAATIWLTVGVSIGVISAVKRRSATDRLAMGFVLFGISAPVFWLGLMALFIFWKKLGLTGGTGYVPITEDPVGFASHMILPWCVLALLFAATYARMTRNSLLETLGEDYIRTARAKGLSEQTVIIKHALRASLTPIVTMFGLDVALLVGGAIITESVFNIQGLGWLAIDSTLNQDLPTVLGVVMVGAIAVAFMNFFVDIAYAFLDPESAVRVSADAGGAPLLDVRNLSVVFPTLDGDVQAVSDLSYSLRRSETLGIVGESGSGKSVSSLAVMGLLNPSRSRITGEILFDGRDLLRLSPKELRAIRGKDIAMIFQDPFACLHPMYRVGDQIAEAVTAHANVSNRVASVRAIELLDAVGIPRAAQRARDYPHQFSGGMRQRAMIAMALANNPSVLIADEPTTALDVTVQAQILELIDRVRVEFDIGVILITHDLGVVAETADNVLVMYGGRALEYGPAREIFAAPQHPYTWGLLSSMPTIERRLEKLVPIEGAPPSLISPPSGCPFHPRCSYVLPQCDQAVPDLRTLSGGHVDRCVLSEEAKINGWAERNAIRLGVAG